LPAPFAPTSTLRSCNGSAAERIDVNPPHDDRLQPLMPHAASVAATERSRPPVDAVPRSRQRQDADREDARNARSL
jgi:hypothetical protein